MKILRGIRASKQTTAEILFEVKIKDLVRCVSTPKEYCDYFKVIRTPGCPRLVAEEGYSLTVSRNGGSSGIAAEF